MQQTDSEVTMTKLAHDTESNSGAEYVDANSGSTLADEYEDRDPPTPTESLSPPVDENTLDDVGSWPMRLTGDDAPEPGSIYIISETDSSKVITNQNGRIALTTFEGTPSKAQKWVCHRSSGWLGFTNDAGESTRYLGHDPDGILICTAGWHLPWEHFCVRKRGGEGFDIMVRHWFGMQPLGYRTRGKESGLLGKKSEWDTWWGFTKVD